jgi:hypothetical protein
MGFMVIDQGRALQILEQAAAEANSSNLHHPWVQKVNQLWQLLVQNRGGKTLVAFIGTAILAKCVEPDVDVFSLKVGDERSGNTYSARSLCQHVLAANAPRLDIDLGVTGREPLNNQPFFGKDRITEDLPIHKKTRPAWTHMMSMLQELESERDKAKLYECLKAFIVSRRSVESRTVDIFSMGGVIDPFQFLHGIQYFATLDAEGGKRAQASVAAVVDVCFQQYEVRVGRINDPDRRFPGDVAIFAGETCLSAIEVREKAISSNDIYHFVNKLNGMGVWKAMMVSFNSQQPVLNLEEAFKFSQGKGVGLSVFYDFYSFAYHALQWSSINFHESVPLIIQKLHDRFEEIEVSTEGREQWNMMLQEMEN